MRFGICGYGNLGRAVEDCIMKSKKDELVAIFSRRSGIRSEHQNPIHAYEDAKFFKDNIDVMIMCGGSQEDLLWQSPQMLQHFDIVDTFDTHAKIEAHRQSLKAISDLFGHRAIYSCGWDPGLFSIARTLAGNIFNTNPQTFWGKGVSQGHSEALRNIRGVSDAIEFTVPKEEVVRMVKSDHTYAPDENQKHQRVCYVATDGTRSFEDITAEIKNTENYFKGQEVIVHKCSPDEVSALKQKMYHKGVVLGRDEQSQMEFNVSMDKNPTFTAQIALAYAHALPKLEKGVYSVLDVPVSKIGDNGNRGNDRYL